MSEHSFESLVFQIAWYFFVCATNTLNVNLCLDQKQKFVARDRDLDICKGYAFVSFVSQFEAKRALEGLNGFGYDNLILRVEWSNKE
jgi:RNA recognition motif-containing protein